MYYADLLIIQYKEKPKAYATVEFLASLQIANQLPTLVMNAFDIPTAVGVQLDVIGKYVGASRQGNGFLGPITLNDTDFRSLIQLKILTNNFGSSLEEIQNLLFTYFATKIYVFDFSNMRMSYLLDTSVGSSDLAQVIVTGGYLPKPMGVQLSSTIYASPLFDFFGFRTYDYDDGNNKPFNTYDVYDNNSPWLAYSYAPGA